MNISETIQVLETFRKENGDLPIVSFLDKELTEGAFALSDENCTNPKDSGKPPLCLVLDF